MERRRTRQRANSEPEEAQEQAKPVDRTSLEYSRQQLPLLHRKLARTRSPQVRNLLLSAVVHHQRRLGL